MNPVQRFFRRYIFSTIGILALFFVVNIALVLSVMVAGYMSGTDNGLSVRSVSSHVTEQGGVWTADDTALALLREHDAWAMLLDESGTVVWEQDLPEGVEPGGRRPDGGGLCAGHLSEILLFHGKALPTDVSYGGALRSLCSTCC